MKNIKLYSTLFILTALAQIGCKKQLQLQPYNGLTTDATFSTINGIKGATIGSYSILKTSNYIRNYHIFSEYPSDNVSLSGTTTDPLFYAYNYQHQVNQSNVLAFWRSSYQAIYSCNNTLAHLPANSQDAELNQIKGENLFLRALLHFNLVNVFGRPYTQNGGTDPGVMIRNDNDVTALPPRSTVKQVYDFVIADLIAAAELMQSNNNNNFASKEVAEALLSRVYLYQGDYANAYKQADLVIQSGRYALVSTADLPTYFRSKPENNKETIFAIKFELKDDLQDGAIGSMYFTAGQGYGEMYASQPLRALLGKHPEDVRNQYIVPQYVTNADGTVQKDAAGNPVLQTRNGYPKYFITKYSYQDGYETLSSPVLFRLAEMYLNRAEAAYHLGNLAQTISDLNTIRQRAGIKFNALYSSGNMQGYTNWIDAILDERRLELDFEGQRKFDVFRNQKDLNRSYPGTHLAAGQNTQIIKYTDPRVAFFIPEAEITVNTNLTQNP